MQPVATEGTFRHHAFIVDAFSKVTHKRVGALSADSGWQESYEVFSEILDCMEDLRLGIHLNDLAIVT